MHLCNIWETGRFLIPKNILESNYTGNGFMQNRRVIKKAYAALHSF